MASAKTIYQQSIEKMQQSIFRLQNQLERSKQLLSHDITIDNRTQQNLNFTIKVSEEGEDRSVCQSQSKVMIPHQATCRHRINTSPIPGSRESSRSPESISHSREKQPITFTYRSKDPSTSDGRMAHQILPMSPLQNYSSIRNERKFQPFSQLQSQSPQSVNESNRRITEPVVSYSSHKHDTFHNSDQNIPESYHSQDVQNEGHVNELEMYSHAQDLKNLQRDIIPLSMSEEKQDDSFPAVVEESPQVFNYIKQFSTDNHQEIYTPMHRQQEIKQPMSITFSPKAYQPKQWHIQPSSIGYQNNKKYFQQVKERQQVYKKIKSRGDQRKKRLNTSKTNSVSKSREKEFKYINKFEHHAPSKYRKQKADDLFMERKNMFLKNLQKSKEKTFSKQQRSRSKSHSIPYTQIINKKTTRNNQSTKELSPRVRQVSERLYSRSKEKLVPCYHYQKHSESIERDRFLGIVHQNSFVQRYVKEEEQEALFQKLRREEDSVSSWPMKILNYTYSKLKKINTNRYTVRNIYA